MSNWKSFIAPRDTTGFSSTLVWKEYILNINPGATRHELYSLVETEAII